MKRFLRLLIAACAIFMLMPQSISADNGISAQSVMPRGTRKVEGFVLDSTGEPLCGATLIVIGTNIGVTTDVDGYYCLDKVPDHAIIGCSFVGFISQQKVANRDIINFVLFEYEDLEEPEPDQN